MPLDSWLVADFLKVVLPQPTWVVPHLIPGDGCTIVLAPGKTGKSVFMMQVCEALVRGTAGDIIGHHPTKSWRPLYIQCDAPLATWQQQIKHMDLKVHQDEPLRLAYLTDGWLDSVATTGEVAALIKQHKADFIVFDSLNTLSRIKDLNEKLDAHQVLFMLRQICGTLPFVTIHHPRKQKQQDESSPYHAPAEDPRDASAGHHYLTTSANGILQLVWLPKSRKGTLRIVNRVEEDRVIHLTRQQANPGRWVQPAGVVQSGVVQPPQLPALT